MARSPGWTSGVASSSTTCSECLVLRDVPLPVPARANWERLLKNLDPSYVRDVTISRNKYSIKYIELEFCSQEDPIPTPASYNDWVRSSSRKVRVIRDGWKCATWTMAMSVGSREDGWHCDRVVDVKDVNLEAGDTCLCDLMVMLTSKTTRTWKELPVALLGINPSP